MDQNTAPLNNEANVEQIFDFLVEHGPFKGTADSLAKAIGMSHSHFQHALGKIRRDTEANGWTVPFVKRGGYDDQVYAVVPTEGHNEMERSLVMKGAERHHRYILTMLRNVKQQAAILKEITTARTQERRWANQLLSTSQYLVEQGDLLQEAGREFASKHNGRASA